MGYEEQMRNFLQQSCDAQIDLDECQPSAFVDLGSQVDDPDYYSILEENGVLGEPEDEKETVKKEVDKKEVETAATQEGSTDMSEDQKNLLELYKYIRMSRKADYLKFEAMSGISSLAVKYPSLSKFLTVIDPLTSSLPTFTPPQYGFSQHGSFTPFGTKYAVNTTTTKLRIQSKFVNNQKVFCCPQCTFTSSGWASVNSHVQTVHTGTSYTCTNCNWQSTNQDSFRRHVKTCTM